MFLVVWIHVAPAMLPGRVSGGGYSEAAGNADLPEVFVDLPEAL